MSRYSELSAKLKKYVCNTREVRTLSSVNVAKLKSSRDYAEALRDNFIHIRTLAEENKKILSGVLEPILDSEEPLTKDEIRALSEFKQELLDAYSVVNLDLPIMAKTVTRLYQDALAKRDVNYIIEQLDAQIEADYALTCYTARVTRDQRIAMGYVREGEEASERFNNLIEKDNFANISDEDSRDLVLINYRYMTAIYEAICQNFSVNDKVVKQFEDALSLLDDPFYREEMPDYNWKYYEMRILDYIAMMTEVNNRRGFTKEQIEFSYECSERLRELWEDDTEYYASYLPELTMRLMVIRNRYLTGRIDKDEYKKELLAMYKTRNDNSYATDDVYANILLPLEYVCIVDIDSINEMERRILLEFYRKMISYAHNTTNSGELMVILNYYYAFLENFIEISDEFTMEEMCLESFAALHPPTYVHSNMVALFARCLCRHLLDRQPGLFTGVLGYEGINKIESHKREILERVYHGALVHDIGKLAIIDTVFVYGRNITDEEFQLIRLHPEAGYYLAVDGTSIATYRDIIVGHHKTYDGKGGYPYIKEDQPSRDKILIDIITVADCLDAATDTVGRSYAKGKTLEQFIEEVHEGSGTRYSPYVAELLDDDAVREDLRYLLTEGREKIYSDTYYLLKNVQEHSKGWDEEDDPEEVFRTFLKEKSKHETARETLIFDIETIAPEKGLEEKADALAMVYLKLKEFLTSPDAERLLRKLAKTEIEDEGLRKSFEILKEEYEKQKRIPNDFYEEFAKEKTLSSKAWEKAKEEDDFSIYEPYLDKMIRMTKKQCAFTEPEKEVYDVLLDEYEKGMDEATIDGLFTDVKAGLSELIDKIDKCESFDASVMEGYYDIDGQRKASRLLLDYIGFDMKAGVLSESVHPFTTRISYGDVRLTNTYREDEAINAMFSAIHEGGHALFEQGIDDKYRGTQIEHVTWMGLHESISRFYENILGRNIAFWKPIYPEIQKLLPKFAEIDLATFERAINDVHRSTIRIDADEVTYGLHVVLRYEMEKAIFTGDIPAHELPSLWNKKSKEIVGIVPKNNAEGILQDTHWSDGSFGYFPSYLLGNIYGGMFLDAMEKELGPVDAILEKGDIRRITEWLTENIFRHGCMYTSKELITRICKKDITAEDWLTYLNKKYGRIYGFCE